MVHPRLLVPALAMALGLSGAAPVPRADRRGDCAIAHGSRRTAEPATPAPPPPAALIGEPIAYRAVPKQAPQEVSSFQFERTERLRVEWPVLRTLDRREVRLLDRTGSPLPAELPLSEDKAAKVIIELPLASLARGEYAIELTAGNGDLVEHRKLAFVMR